MSDIRNEPAGLIAKMQPLEPPFRLEQGMVPVEYGATPAKT